MAAYVDRFLEVRRTGRHDPDWYLHPVMRSLLEETFGVMTYQEDVLRVAGKVAGMDAADADGLRVHRSWWVARKGVVSAERAEGRIRLKLRSGEVVPVSRSYQGAVKDAGFAA